MAKVLLTGFEPFAGATKNSSAEVVRWIGEQSLDDLVIEILPVEYQRSVSELIRVIEEQEPDIVLSLGQAEGRSKISLERIAINLDDAAISDNAGEIRRDTAIRSDGAPAYFTNIPIREVLTSLTLAGHSAEISLSAGSFVCNHIFYEALHHLYLSRPDRKIWMEFVHLPLVDQQNDEFPGKPVMGVEVQGRAIATLIEECKKLFEINSSSL